MRTRVIILTFTLIVASLAWWLQRDALPVRNPERRFELYDFARYLGRNDNLTPRSRDPRRWEEKLGEYADLADARAILEKGYNDGFDQHPEEPMRLDEETYDRDYRSGLRDRTAGKPPAMQTPGYEAGYNGTAHRYGRPY